MAEYPYVSKVLCFYGGLKYSTHIFKGSYESFYCIIGSMEFVEQCKKCLIYGTEEQANRLKEIINHVWFPGYVQLESGNALSMDLVKRTDEKLEELFEDPLKKSKFIDMYDPVCNNLFYYSDENNKTIPYVHPAFVLNHLTNEEKLKLRFLHQQLNASLFIHTLLTNYPKHRYMS